MDMATPPNTSNEAITKRVESASDRKTIPPHCGDNRNRQLNYGRASCRETTKSRVPGDIAHTRRGCARCDG